ncbi:MAG: NAD(P)-dependent alcohol dehydrogenase [Promethearchaeota archaeon]
MQGLRKKRLIQPGQKVLISGAGGGMGMFAVQIAKSFGAEVTGVDRTSKLDMMRSIGADHVVDYTQEDFTKSDQRYDRILDVAANHSILDYKRALNHKGICYLVGGSNGTLIKALILGPLISIFGSKKIGLLLYKPNNKEDIVFLTELFKAGKVVPVIDKRYPLSEVAEAFRYLEEGHHQGKIVINIVDNTKS